MRRQRQSNARVGVAPDRIYPGTTSEAAARSATRCAPCLPSLPNRLHPRSPWTHSGYVRSSQKSPKMRCSTSSIASSTSILALCREILVPISFPPHSAITTDTPGRVDKQNVLQSIQASGESYDRAREVLKHVSVDSSGKVELEDWVEVRASPSSYM